MKPITAKTTIRHFSSSPSNTKKDHAHCVELVAKRDRDAFLCGLLMPQDAQRSYFALRALNVEVASIKDSIDPNRRSGIVGDLTGGDEGDGDVNTMNLPAHVRMDWWREALHGIYLDPHNLSSLASSAHGHHPVVREVREAIATHGLTQRFLERVLDARQMDLDNNQMETLQDMVDYGEETYSSLLYLTLECLGVQNDQADTLASHLGVSLSLVTALRSTVPRASRRSELSIPAQLMRQHAVPSWYLLNPTAGSRRQNTNMEEEKEEAQWALQNAVQELARVAQAHLLEARRMQHDADIPKRAQTAWLPAVPALHYLEQLEQLNYDVLHADINVVDGKEGERMGKLRVPLLLGRAWLTGTF